MKRRTAFALYVIILLAHISYYLCKLWRKEKRCEDLEMKTKASNLVENGGRMLKTGHVIVLDFFGWKIR